MIDKTSFTYSERDQEVVLEFWKLREDYVDHGVRR